MMRRRKRLKRCAPEEESDTEDEDEQNNIKCIGNKIYFYAVNKKTSLDLHEKLAEAAKFAHSNETPGEKPTIYLFIHSDGGDAYVGLSLYDHLQRMNTRVVTIADGFVASAASLILLGGHERWGLLIAMY